jgi:hypothetical protein
VQTSIPKKIMGIVLKGPKLEIFSSGVFAQIRPEWVGDLGNSQKIQQWDGIGLTIANLYFLAQ